MLFSNMTNYAQEKSDGLWRRSLYTYWKRTVMPPAMQVFDASSANTAPCARHVPILRCRR